MAALGYSITGISDIPISGEVENVIADKPGFILREGSTVNVFLTRETVDVRATVTIGGSTVLPSGPVNTIPAVGTLPSTQDDRLVTVVAAKGDTIIIAGVNQDAGEARELRVLVKVTPIAQQRLAGGRAG